MEISGKVTCSICIATYKRIILLEKLLVSLLNQELNDNIFLEIIVVDNDDMQSARDIVSKIKCPSGFSLSYFFQPIKNISLTRNLAIKNATGEYLAFIDDDEAADKQWVQNLISTVMQFNADGVFGFVVPVFPPNVSPWLKQREIYFRPMGNTGSQAKFTYTTNCLIKSKIVKSNNILFDERYGLTGGEDTLFFTNLLDKGAKFVSCREAISYEFIPFERTKLKYLFFRAFQGGNTFARRMIELKNNKFNFTRLLILFKAILSIAYYFLKTTLLIPVKKKWILSFMRLASNIGKIFAVFNYYNKPYKN